jgi:hypothetical protein
MANAPRSPIEWLHDKIRYEQDCTQLRNIAMVLLFSLDDPEPIHQYFGKEMDEEGFYDNYEKENQKYDDGSGWLGDDKADWDMASSLAEGHIKGVLNK